MCPEWHSGINCETSHPGTPVPLLELSLLWLLPLCESQLQSRRYNVTDVLWAICCWDKDVLGWYREPDWRLAKRRGHGDLRGSESVRCQTSLLIMHPHNHRWNHPSFCLYGVESWKLKIYWHHHGLTAPFVYVATLMCEFWNHLLSGWAVCLCLDEHPDGKSEDFFKLVNIFKIES